MSYLSQYRMNKKGFTYLELAVAMVILIIALLPLIAMLAGPTASSQYGVLVMGRRQEDRSTCIFLAKRTLDDIKSRLDVNYFSISTGTSPPFHYDDYPGFYYSTDINHNAIEEGGLPDRIKRIRVTVWKEESGNIEDRAEERFTLQSLVTNKNENWQ